MEKLKCTLNSAVADTAGVLLGQVCWRSTIGGVAIDATTTSKITVQQVTESEHHSATYVGEALLQ